VADYCEMLVRTDPNADKHRGISWLIVPMDTPGIDVRPLRTMRGSSEFSEVFLDDVRVPVANRVGEENDGWRVAMVTFSFERGTAFVSELLQSMQLVRELAKLVQDDPRFQREIGHIVADFDALWALTKRNVSQAARTGVPGVGGSVFKLHYSETRHRLGELAMKVLERDGLSIDNKHVEGQIHAIAITIAAGTSQVQRNIVAERVLGLPRER
jgi:alkylation response protein AidB-like acyl-CoA dehydrogenase